MTENLLKKPKELINQAVSAIKGPDVETLVEEFTSEMTLVAEGLCEDQQRLRRELEEVKNHRKTDLASTQSRQDQLLNRISQWERETDDRLKALSARVDQLEKKQPKTRGAASVIRQATLLAAIVCGSWVVVTLLNLLKSLLMG